MQLFNATQEFSQVDREKARNFLIRMRQTAAFEEWRKRLHPNDRLPRGVFFKGKKAGSALFIMDEYHLIYASTPFYPGQSKPFETIKTAHPPAGRGAPSSLARSLSTEVVDSARVPPEPGFFSPIQTPTAANNDVLRIGCGPSDNSNH